MKNRQVILAARPEGLPQEPGFRLAETGLTEAGEGQFRRSANLLFVHPRVRSWSSEFK